MRQTSHIATGLMGADCVVCGAHVPPHSRHECVKEDQADIETIVKEVLVRLDRRARAERRMAL